MASPTTTDQFTVYSLGLCYASVCSSLSPEETTERLNREAPTGINHPWSLAEEDFSNGAPNPCACEHTPLTHKHYLFSC